MFEMSRVDCILIFHLETGFLKVGYCSILLEACLRIFQGSVI